MSEKSWRSVLPQIFFWDNLFVRKNGASSIRDVLKRNALFQDLSNSELRYVERIVHVRHYEAGEAVFQQGERALGMYIITAGHVNILVRAPLDNRGRIRETLIVTLAEGAFFGEHSLIESEAIRTASAVATEPTTLIAFMKPDLMEIVQRRPNMSLKITLQLARVLSTRLRKTTEKLSEISSEEEQREAAKARFHDER